MATQWFPLTLAWWMRSIVDIGSSCWGGGPSWCVGSILDWPTHPPTDNQHNNNHQWKRNMWHYNDLLELICFLMSSVDKVSYSWFPCKYLQKYLNHSLDKLNIVAICILFLNKTCCVLNMKPSYKFTSQLKLLYFQDNENIRIVFMTWSLEQYRIGA